ncbi:class I SAM-dependent methyltransferase [Herbiconiux solani]|uniref:class I SAM-dependent methyltransferase n=1 Tax=Herbiconiux solani TaxID=661329 RepID=UPI000826E735|nr:class I SAM-dependent methyltransferase [Herbiconiux solani]
MNDTTTVVDTTLADATLADTRIRDARMLAARWDAQQTGYIRHRAERFDTIARVVAAVCEGVDEPRILDLAGGTGSLAARVLTAVPEGRAVVADKDPALLAIAADLASADPRLTTAEVDLARPDWAEHPLIADAPFDAVVSSTALHWLQPGELVDVYRALPGILRPGGILLNGDHLAYDTHQEATLARIARDDDAEMQESTFAGDTDTWDEWWQAVAESPRYAEALRRRESVWGEALHQAPPKVTLGFHLEALRSAGFTETGTVWRYLDDHVLYGITPNAPVRA